MTGNVPIAFSLLALLCGCRSKDVVDTAADLVVHPPARIGFGSCSDALLPLTMFDVATNREVELYVFLGDNVYADTIDMEWMRTEYAALGAAPEFQRLDAQAELLATWDDHDYGQNDAGKNYPMKVASKQVFMDFWEEPLESPRWEHEGIYHAVFYEGTPYTLQIILLDTRTFRDDLTPNDGTGKNDYIPNPDPSLAMLGEAQWAWLETQLQADADLRLIATSNQFGHEYNGFESWNNLPSERQRMLDLITSTQANGVVFLSGDVHWGEISAVPIAPGYDTFDVTSSGINRVVLNPEPNANRVGEVVPEYNVGIVDIDWDAASPEVSISLYDGTDINRSSVVFAIDDLTF